MFRCEYCIKTNCSRRCSIHFPFDVQAIGRLLFWYTLSKCIDQLIPGLHCDGTYTCTVYIKSIIDGPWVFIPIMCHSLIVCILKLTLIFSLIGTISHISTTCTSITLCVHVLSTPCHSQFLNGMCPVVFLQVLFASDILYFQKYF